MKWQMQIVLAILEAAFVLTAVYFEPSYGVRGRLWGEAFFDGRPTSYWRGQIDRWIACHDSIAAAQNEPWEYRFYTDGPLEMAGYQLGGNGSVTLSFPAPDQNDEPVELTIHFSTRPTAGEWAKSLWNRGDPGDGRDLPKILSGLFDAEPVWLELERDVRHRPFVVRARRLSHAIHGFKTDAEVARQTE